MKIISKIVPVSFLILITFFSIQCKLLKNILSEEEEIDVITTITSDDESALSQALFYLWKKGGIIYIDTPIINFKEQGSLSVTGTLKGGIIGIKQDNGEYPLFNFKAKRDSTELLYQYSSGIDVVGSNKFIKNIIIENAGAHGIFINGNKNIIENVITRYNGQSGIYISSGSNSNFLNYCYSYRNFNFYGKKVAGDGFTVEIRANNNVFNECYAWDNIGNGFGYVYSEGEFNNGALTYTHSASWNNGNINVFSGKYDFENGKDLDKNMWTIQEIIKSDDNFEKNYNNKIYNLDEAKIDSKPAVEYLEEYKSENGGNGFNLGDENNEQNLINKRTVDYCVSFDHRGKGFNNNKSLNFTGLITNSVGFSNDMNYDLPYSFMKWSNNWSWSSNKKDIFDLDVFTKTPNDIKNANKNFYSIRDKIMKAIYNNTFPEDCNFDKVIKSLSQ